MQQSVQKIQFDKNAKIILEKRYLQKDKDNRLIETPEERFDKIVTHIVSPEKDIYKPLYYKLFYDLLASGKFLPNSPTLVNAGTKNGSLSACFVISPQDTMQSIMQVAYDAAMIEKWGGGIGFGFSQLRPKGDKISTTHGKALGVVETMKIYSQIGESITQGAFRLGAHMANLMISHPEIFDFIHCKDDGRYLSNFNISVQVTDKFLQQVENDGEWDLINPRDNNVVKTVKAKELWKDICQSAWLTGDPGLSFIDRVWETQPNPQLGYIQASNPCSEEYLENYCNCCLGSINLGKFVAKNNLDYSALEDTIRLSVRFLDNVIEVNQFPIEKLKEMNLATRRIGLGIMGWADLLVKLSTQYDSDEAIELARTLGKFIKDKAWDASKELAAERGPFPEYENSALKNSFGYPPVRHSSVITIAPTGTISRLLNCSSGIEPYFSLAWNSNILWEDQKGKTTHLTDAPLDIKEKLFSVLLDVDQVNAILSNLANNPKEATQILAKYGIDSKLFRTAHEISPEWHIKMQAAWQENVSNGISKTINLPHSATIEDISNAYLLAWKLGCKGLTVYREGSREKEVLSTGKTKKVYNKVKSSRPKSISGVTTKINTGHGSTFVTLNVNGHPYEVFSTLGKAGKCDAAYLEAISRLISLSLQSGIDVEEITKQLSGITCCPSWHEGHKICSVPDGIAYAMKENFLKDKIVYNTSSGMNMFCPDCNANLVNESGCLSCKSCGWSKC